MSIPIARPFAFNSGPPIDGTIQVLNLAVGYPTYGFDSTGLQWWNGPDESLGYVIAQSVPDNSQPTPVYGLTASVGFYRTNGFNDSEFIFLANKLLGTTFITASEASKALTSNGYWNSYASLVLSLDAGNTLSYPGYGTEWTDLIDGKVFNLINGPEYIPSNGGKIYFSSADNQYAQCHTSLSTLSQWSVSVWHYYTNQNTGESPCIITEVYPGLTNKINFIIGNGSNTNSDLQTGFYNEDWLLTENGYTLIPNNWYYIVGTYDGSTLKLYVNNNLINTTYQILSNSLSSQGGINLMIRWNNATTEIWDGFLSTVDIYNNALNQSQITSYWISTKSRFGL